MNKNVIITGASGFVAGSLIKYLEENKYIVSGISRSIDVDKDAYSKLSLLDKISKFCPSFIIHCASSSSVSGSSLSDPDSLSSSQDALVNLLEACRISKFKGRLLFISSAAVYGNPITLPIREDDSLLPISQYGIHKVICESICSFYKRVYQVDIKIIRPFSIYGEDQKKLILFEIMQGLRNSNTIKLRGTGNESRDFIHIYDFCRFVEYILNTNSPHDVFNAANGHEITIKDVISIILEFTNAKVEYGNVMSSDNPANWRADVSRSREIGYSPSISIERGIRRLLEANG